MAKIESCGSMIIDLRNAFADVRHTIRQHEMSGRGSGEWRIALHIRHSADSVPPASASVVWVQNPPRAQSQPGHCPYIHPYADHAAPTLLPHACDRQAFLVVVA